MTDDKDLASLLAPVVAIAKTPAARSALSDLCALVIALRRRVTRLEEQPRLRFLGVHEPGCTYQPGTLVVRSGGLWHCHAATTETPGHSSHWQLAVKSGQAAARTVTVR